jgi:hypothetical protein
VTKNLAYFFTAMVTAVKVLLLMAVAKMEIFEEKNLG